MEYHVLTADHRRAMWRQTVGALEERHYALTMDRVLAAAIRPRAGEAIPAEVGQRLRDLDAQLAAVEQQHARAVAELDDLGTDEAAPTPIRGEGAAD